VSSTLFAPPTAETLAQQHPEWKPWLALLEVTSEEAAGPAWSDAIPAEPRETPPLLAGCALAIERGVAERWLRRLFAASGVEALREGALRSDPLSILEAAVNLDLARLGALARQAQAPADAFCAVAPLAAMPWLQACGRRWATLAAAESGWCPVCAAWPILAEARGLEGQRRLRCARCGGDWRTQWLTCPFCGIDDHTRLTSLVADGLGESRKIEACRECMVYVKTVTTLAAADVATLRLLDLSTVELDLVALGRGFSRPAGRGHPLGVTVIERPARRFWRR
jgi:FdhE protein